MIALYILLGLLALVLLLLAICAVRAALLKPTSARTSTAAPCDPQRAADYGQKLSAMVKAETVSVRGDEDIQRFLDFHKVLEGQFPAVFAACEKTVLDGSLLLRWPGSGSAAPMLLMSHSDVVEATGSWEHGPFSGDITPDGRVWGRGTVDTKGSLCCIFQAVEELIQSGYRPQGDVYIASSCTEEIGGKGGPATAAYLKEKGVKLGLLLDEGGMIMDEPMPGIKGRYAVIGVLEKGYGDVKFIANGNGGHASAPPKNSPIVRLAKFIACTEKKNPFTARFPDPVREMFRRFAPNMAFGMKFVFANLWLFEPLLCRVMGSISPAGAAMLQTTLAFTMQSGARGTNVLPQEAWAIANMRFIPHQGTDESLDIVEKLAAKFDIKTEVLYRGYPTATVDYRGSAFTQVEKTIEKIFPGIGVSPYVMTGGTDARFYGEVCDNCLRFAPLEIDKQQFGSIHALNENISSSVLPAGVDFYKEVITTVKL